MRHKPRFGDVLLLVVGAAALALVLAKATPWTDGGSAQAGSRIGPAPLAAGHRYEELAELTVSHHVLSSPGGPTFERISRARPITGEQTVLPVLRSAHHGNRDWLEVMLPGRPNGLTGWIQQSGAKLEFTPWHLVVDTARRHVYVYDAGHLVRAFRAVVGASATPTPKGQFFVEESVALARTAVGYPYALALSARSNVLQEFDGGPGQIALHGLDNVGGTLGTAESNGCVRLGTSNIKWLANHIDPGVPVTVQ